ncbi:hypothetical protein [Parasphingorhabdus sp.]|uniref:hypothetical protein n=1 Tax=Parasphingorhabdus sp. TaxID=2709688 RepID=UPI003266B372
MSIGLFELTIAASILLLMLIWWLWPKHDRGDLSAPPKEFDNQPKMQDPKPRPAPAISSQTSYSQKAAVRDESDYSEEDLMTRDVRAALLRGDYSAAMQRVLKTRNISDAEALRFVKELDRHSER